MLDSMAKRSDDANYSNAEIVQRREAALKRMLSTPHRPHKPLRKKSKNKEAESA
jgi:hypothetical protein